MRSARLVMPKIFTGGISAFAPKENISGNTTAENKRRKIYPTISKEYRFNGMVYVS